MTFEDLSKLFSHLRLNGLKSLCDLLGQFSVPFLLVLQQYLGLAEEFAIFIEVYFGAIDFQCVFSFFMEVPFFTPLISDALLLFVFD